MSPYCPEGSALAPPEPRCDEETATAAWDGHVPVKEPPVLVSMPICVVPGWLCDPDIAPSVLVDDADGCGVAAVVACLFPVGETFP